MIYSKNTFATVLLIFLVFMTLFIISCKKFVTIPPPKNELVTSTLFADSVSATSAVLGIYINIMGSPALNITNGGLSLFAGLSSDELAMTDNSSFREFYQNAISPISTLNDGYAWALAYKTIYQANACIDGLNASSLPVSVKNELIGESKFIRALFYFNMENLYGPVPLITSIQYPTNAILPRTPVDSIEQQIINDLTDCLTLLPPDNHLNGNTRPNVNAARALLARIYLYQKQWSKAQSTSSQVINSGVYSLDQDLNNVFLPSSFEAIWQLSPVMGGEETPEGGYYVPYDNTTVPVYVINSYLLNAFEPGDNRRAMWLDSNVVNGQVYYYPYKYKLGRDNNSSPMEYVTILRLAEQYLIRAEAEANLGGSELGDAVTDLNTVRARANLSAYAGTIDQQSLLKAILHERQTELFVEWGHRWFDLKRTGSVDSVMGTDGVCAAKGGTWKSDWQLYPIPFPQIQINNFLTQNNGYN